MEHRRASTSRSSAWDPTATSRRSSRAIHCSIAAALADSPKPPPARVTLTLDALAAASEIWVVAFGREKAAAVADARDNPASQLPVAIVARAARRVQWFLDDNATGA